MNPYERRIIHAAVSQVEGALSTSVGEEPNRRVVISSANPKKPRTDGRGKGKGGSRRGGRPSGESRGEGKSSRERRPYREREELKEPEAPRAPISEEERILRSAPPSEAADLPLFGKIEIDD
jgi:spoIIIJ-associated protein